jgi:hypothetical protein
MMSNCRRCGGVIGIHGSTLPGCMCIWSSPIRGAAHIDLKLSDDEIALLQQHARRGWDYARELEDERKALTEVLMEAMNLIGPDAPECCGCRYEWQKAVDLIKKRLGEK